MPHQQMRCSLHYVSMHRTCMHRTTKQKQNHGTQQHDVVLLDGTEPLHTSHLHQQTDVILPAVSARSNSSSFWKHTRHHQPRTSNRPALLAAGHTGRPEEKVHARRRTTNLHRIARHAQQLPQNCCDHSTILSTGTPITSESLILGALHSTNEWQYKFPVLAFNTAMRCSPWQNENGNSTSVPFACMFQHGALTPQLEHNTAGNTIAVVMNMSRHLAIR